MAVPDFSESSYVFAYTSELSSLWAAHLVGAPTFPSQVEEGNEGGGYDVRLDSTGFVYFVQFKLAQYLAHWNSAQADFGLPYYRFPIYRRKRNRQHQLLIDLDAQDGAVVEYAAPKFHTQNALDKAFASRAVVTGSRRVVPSAIGPLPDDAQHFVVYRKDGSDPTLYSEPVPLTGPVDAGTIVESGFQQEVLQDGSGMAKQPDRTEPQPSLREIINNVTGLLMESAGGRVVQAVERLDDPVEQLSAIAAIHLGLGTFVVSTPIGDLTGEDSSAEDVG